MAIDDGDRPIQVTQEVLVDLSDELVSRPVFGSMRVAERIQRGDTLYIQRIRELAAPHAGDVMAINQRIQINCIALDCDLNNRSATAQSVEARQAMASSRQQINNLASLSVSRLHDMAIRQRFMSSLTGSTPTVADPDHPYRNMQSHMLFALGKHVSDWTVEVFVPRSKRKSLGKENAELPEFFNVEPWIDPVMSKTHPGISKANLGYRQSNNYFKQMIAELCAE